MRADYEVLHLRSSAGLYGAEYVVLGLVPALADLGIGGRLLCLDNPYLAQQPLLQRAAALGVPAQRLSCTSRLDIGSVRALRALLAAHPAAILHVHDYKSAAYAWLARRGSRRCIVATAHGHFADSLRLRVYQGLESLLMRRFEAICLVSARMRAGRLAAASMRTRIHLIENGIDTTRFRADVPSLERAGLAIPDDAIVFGAAMRLAEQKNPLGLVDAFAQVLAVEPRALLAIAGDGPLRTATEQRIAALGIASRVRLLGARDDLDRFYPLLDVFVLPSLYEGLPLALLEAMASERPVVATAVGQVPAVLDGLAECVRAGDTAALAGAMRRALDRPGAQPALRRRVLERYSLARMAHDYAGVYESVWRTAHGDARS